MGHFRNHIYTFTQFLHGPDLLNPRLSTPLPLNHYQFCTFWFFCVIFFSLFLHLLIILHTVLSTGLD